MNQTGISRPGDHKYKDNTFSYRQWAAPSLTDPAAIRARLRALGLVGRKIKHLKLIGLSYDHVRDWIEEQAYTALEGLEEEERQRGACYSDIGPDVLLSRWAEIDEPLLIRFEDGDIFQILTPLEGRFCFSLNEIPWQIEAGINPPNLDANLFFAPCIGRTISSVQVNTYLTDKDPMYICYFDSEHSQRVLVSSIDLLLEDGNGIRIEGWSDYCQISLIGPNQQVLSIPFRELKPALFNWEDLHIDPVTGFWPDGSEFFFGELGEQHVASPYLTLSSQDKQADLYVTYTDFLLFEWAITWQIRDCFDEYGESVFSAEEWESILEKAEEIVSFHSFDELFDALVGCDIKNRSGVNLFCALLNGGGAVFWKHRDRFKRQLSDMRRWTKLALSQGGGIKIYGF